ncbi:MAG TPA: hypothetical protein DHV14_11605 [Micrococcales bacterium]|uniref:hypothetical protein n=1 Tax=Miniimonas TaxID=947525 RepID=UPI000D527F9C|nr:MULTISPECIES: hypothetical protein [Miniimonas]HCX85760.1 hypothetical protein [Micrococcales bacterium]
MSVEVVPTALDAAATALQHASTAARTAVVAPGLGDAGLASDVLASILATFPLAVGDVTHAGDVCAGDLVAAAADYRGTDDGVAERLASRLAGGPV